jgi:hypothetical protein
VSSRNLKIGHQSLWETPELCDGRAAIRTKRWISEQMSHQIHRLAAVVTSGVSHRDRGKLPELRSLLILLLSTRQSRRQPSRLGCRLNAGGAQWAERHECRSAACPRSVACARPAKVAIGVVCDICARHDRSHAPRGNAAHDATAGLLQGCVSSGNLKIGHQSLWETPEVDGTGRDSDDGGGSGGSSAH